MISAKEKRGKLKAYYDSLVAQREILEKFEKDRLVTLQVFEFFATEIQGARADFPELLPAFDRNAFGYSRQWNSYDRTVMEVYLAACIARLKASLEETKNNPVIETVDFSFIKEIELREIIERDFIEAQRAYVSECWKSVIILSGGSLEAILLDCLIADESRAKSAKAAPNKDLSRWDLSEIIKVVVELKIVEPSVEALGNAVRRYRNLVHPGNELQNKLKVSRLEADSALNALKIVHRDLST